MLRALRHELRPITREVLFDAEIPDVEEKPEDKLLLALDMFEFGTDLMLQNLNRRYPDSPAEVVDREFLRWLQQPRSAPDGDCVGRRVSLDHLVS